MDVSNFGMSGRATSSVDPGSPSNAQYQARLESVKRHHDDLEQKAREKAERDQIKNEERRRRGKEELDRKAAKAGESVKAWEKKSADTVERRQQLAIKNDGEFDAKMAAAKMKK